MIFPKVLKLVFSMSFIFSCAQKKEASINGFLDNHTFNSPYEDSINFKTDNIFSVTKFKKPEKNDSISAKFNGLSYTKE
ncbi:hypothetical protein, partial [Brevibacillus sp. SIMBA_040]|uniref:hypothetical protein n=1 Tax=Brevibacillus sp. SIMBA_040 TaxID=3085781 RepID=UPI00397C3C36